MDTVIKVSHLTKSFKGFIAVNDISFDVATGEVFAFLGPNGAGKSTTIKILITLLAATSGEATINGYSVAHDAINVRRSIGYVPQMVSVDGALSAVENMHLMARMYDIPAKEREKRVSEVLEFLDLSKEAHNLVRTFSGGMVRKVEIGESILHHPKVLFLDEPTSGLDPVARRNVWKHLLELRNTFGTTIFFSTHYMDEAEEVSDRVAIMHNGSIAAMGPVDELKQLTHIENAALEDAFIFFTGATVQESGNIKQIRRLREQERRRQ